MRRNKKTFVFTMKTCFICKRTVCGNPGTTQENGLAQ